VNVLRERFEGNKKSCNNWQCWFWQICFSSKLHTVLDLPVFYLDQYFWKPQWTHPNLDKYKTVHDALCDKDEWIIDGMQLRFLEYRIQKADIVISLDTPTYICFWRIFKRVTRYYGKKAPGSAPGCLEGVFNWKFIKFLWWVRGFKAKYLSHIMKLLHAYSDVKEIYTFKSSQEVELFLKES